MNKTRSMGGDNRAVALSVAMMMMMMMMMAIVVTICPSPTDAFAPMTLVRVPSRTNVGNGVPGNSPLTVLQAKSLNAFPGSTPDSNQNKRKDSSTSMKALTVGMMPNGPSLPERASFLWQNLMAKIKGTSEVTMWRIAAGIFLSSLVIFNSSIDAGLIQFWAWLQNSSSMLPRMFRHDHWEWMVATCAFLVWIHGFWFADRAVIRASKQGKVHPWKKFRLQDRFEFQRERYLLRQRQKRGADVEATAEPALTTKQTAWNWQAWVFELPLYVIPLFVVDRMFPRRAAKLARWAAPTTFQICWDVTRALLAYDIMFFCGHWTMHKVPFIYNMVHKKHHINKECRAAEIVRLSFVEEVLEVGFSIVALNTLKCHPVARTIYNCIITFLLTELHCGFDFPWTPQNVVPFGFATGSRRHHYHHRFGYHYYQKFFCHVDRLFGFIQKKDDTLLSESVQPFKDPPAAWTN